MALFGMGVAAISLCTRQPACIWRLLGKATSKARDAADYSRVVRVGIDDTAKRCDQSCISIMADLNRQCAITEGKGQRWQAGSETSLRSIQGPDEGLRGHTRHGKDITPWESPQRCPRPLRSWTASMWWGLVNRTIDPVRCTQRRDCEERGARPREDTSQGGAYLPDGKAMQDTYGCPDRESTAKAPDRLCL